MAEIDLLRRLLVGTSRNDRVAGTFRKRGTATAIEPVVRETHRGEVEVGDRGTVATKSMNLIEDARAIPETLARAIVEDGSLSARKLASSVKGEDRLDFARAVVFGVVSAYWKELPAVSGRDWSLCELPADIGVSSVPAEAEEQAESIGRAAARLDVLEASYMIGVLYTGMMPARFRAQLGAYYTPAGAVRAAAGHGDGGRCRLAFSESARPSLWRGRVPGAGGATNGGKP